MLKVTLQKIWHKKWMVLCMLLGCILLIATVVSFPLYRHAAFDRMLQDEFNQYVDETGLWPCIDQMTVAVKQDREGATVTKMENALQEIGKGLGVTDKEKKALERSAKRAGLSLSAFLRKAGLNERIFVKPSASLFKAYEATERLLKKFPSFSKSDIEVCLIDIEEKLLDAYHEKEADSDGDNQNLGD